MAPPVGGDTADQAAPVTVELPPDAPLLAFTDGLVERRGEDLDIGLRRLRAAADDDSRPLEEDLDRLLHLLADPGDKDDTVLLVLRWQQPAHAGTAVC